VIHAFEPVSTYSLPSATALAVIALMSEPACASDSAYAPSDSPPTMSGSSRAFCSWSPYDASAYDVIVCTETPTPTLIQAAAISSSICRYTSYGCPPPPYSSG
jgi:hypothetical protein